MTNFVEFVEKIEYSSDVKKIGLAKIIPPQEYWNPSDIDFENLDYDIVNPLNQKFKRISQGAFEIKGKRWRRDTTLREYRKLTTAVEPANPENKNDDRYYWDHLDGSEVTYGADVAGSFFNWDWSIWNLRDMKTPLQMAYNFEGFNTPGIQTSSLFFGCYMSTFGWHVEDLDFYALNYLWFGASKTWYVIPPANGFQFEQTATDIFWKNYQLKCQAPLRHKGSMIDPQLLRDHYKIPVYKVKLEFLCLCE